MKFYLASALLTFLISAPVFSNDLQIGDQAPEKLGTDSSGQPVNTSDYKGKVLVISFWATWCGPCKKELPMLGALQQKLGNSNLQVIAITFNDTKDNFKIMAKALADHPLKLTFDKNERIGKQFDVTAIPNLWVVDRNGKIVSHHIGYTEEKIRDTLLEIVTLVNQPIASQ